MSKNIADIPRLVKFLADVKKDICEQFPNGEHIGGVGSIVGMHYLDNTITTLNEQHTKISILKAENARISEENRKYREKYGEIY